MDSRAHRPYTPDEGGPIDVWHFRGWFPGAAGDPAPEDYLSGDAADAEG